MKKNLLIFLFLGVFSSQSYAQTLTFEEGTSLTETLTTSASDTLYDMKAHLFSDATSDIVISWDASNNTSPSGWFLFLCDIVNCYNLAGVDAGSFTLEAGDTAEFKAQFNPNLVEGTGTISVTTQIDGDSSSAKSFTFTLDVDTITTGVFDTKIENVNIYPNPATSMLNIEIPKDANVNAIKVFNIIGKELISNSIANDQDIANISVTDLEPGMYLIKLEGKSNTLYTSTFVVK